MEIEKNKYIILSLGGSLLVPDKIDVQVYRQYVLFLRKWVRKGYKFVVVVGGGNLARTYQQATKKICGKANQQELDWVGIAATRLNAEVLRNSLHNLTGELVFDPTKTLPKKPVIIAGGWKPGWSTDFVAVELAKKLGSKIIINLTDLYYVYSADPKKDKQAQPLKDLAWLDFKKLVGNKWTPGAHLPFDPVAARLASQNKMEVVITNGNDLKNLENILDNKKAKATYIV